MGKEIEFLVISILVILAFYYFIRVCILYFKNKKEDIDRFEKICNVTLINSYTQKLLIVNVILYIINNIIECLGG